ncbi:TatD family hydrolase [Clostridiaceae bacterium M8S5]|nr:TatD family hydrolase [Clostridiaceae bacterium M8S5]
MNIIDSHIHFSNIESFKKTAVDMSKVDYSFCGYIKEFEANNIVASIAMGVQETKSGSFPDENSLNPMLLDLEKDIPHNIYSCVGINPSRLVGVNKNEELKNIEKYIQTHAVKALKIYAGYYHYHVYDDVYKPVYELAVKYKLPVVIHSGDTYSERGILKYSHPLNVDELAVYNRDIHFVIAHLGDPWVMDCAEVVYKNDNVFADLSGLIVGDRQQVEKTSNQKLFFEHIKRALVYADCYNKFMFGSDWPLVEIGSYVEFIKKLIPLEYHEDVFYNNAKRIFKL